jgi:tRNA(fMet)-specific endonuclease VapC
LSEILRGKNEGVRKRAAVLAGRMYGALERTGRPIGRIDPMIAAIAASENLDLVTGNQSHYQRLVELEFPLRLTNWRTA